MEDFNICAECMFCEEVNDGEYICTAYRTGDEVNKVRKVRNNQTACDRFYSPEIKISRMSAVTWHREMWNWIADNVEEIKPGTSNEIKNAFLDIYGIEKLESSCFCCEYGYCDQCPIKWREKHTPYYYQMQCMESEYQDFRGALKHSQYTFASVIARKIAELPERA